MAARAGEPVGSSLKDLKALKQRLDAAAREAAERDAALRHAEIAREREHDLFVRSVGPVQPLKGAAARAQPSRARPRPEPVQRRRDEQAVLREALSDDFDVETLLDTDEALSYRRLGIGPDVPRRLRRGEWAIQAQVDLHGLRRDEARERLGGFLHEAARHGLRCVRVVHGKGNGSPGRQSVLKGKVRSWLVQKAEVLAFVQAGPSDGGSGALLVLQGAGSAG
jgi:DNA-nicking Smr family endonuclease